MKGIENGVKAPTLLNLELSLLFCRNRGHFSSQQGDGFRVNTRGRTVEIYYPADPKVNTRPVGYQIPQDLILIDGTVRIIGQIIFNRMTGIVK